MKNETGFRKAGKWQAWILILINQMPMMAILALIPTLQLLGEHYKGAQYGHLLVPMILSIPGLFIGLIALFAGYLTDKLGRRKLLIGFMLLYCFGGIIPFFLDSFNALIVGRLLLGIGEAFAIVIGYSLLGDYFSSNQRIKWLAIQGFFGSVAAFLVLSLSGYLANFGWNYPFLVYIVIIVLTLLAWGFIFEPTRGNERNEPYILEIPSKFPVKAVFSIFLTTFTFAVLYFVYTIHFSLALDEMGIKDKIQLGNINAITSTAVPIGTLIFWCVAKRPFWQQLVLIFFFFTIGLGGIGLAQDTTTAMIMGWIQQLGCGMISPVLLCWALKILPPEFRGRGMGFWISGFFLGQFLNPVFISFIQKVSGGLLQTFVSVGIICFVVMIMILVYNMFLKKKVKYQLIV